MKAVMRIGIAGKITAYLNNGDELYGAVTQIDQESLSIADVDLHRVVTVQYKNVKKVRTGYGNMNVFTGKRPNFSPGVKRFVMVGVLVALVGLPLILVATAKD
jgi:hypothetical protein